MSQSDPNTDHSASFSNYWSQFVDTLLVHREATAFILKNKLWEGFWKYGWVAGILIGVAVLFSLKFISIFWNWLDHFRATENASTIAEMGVLMQSMAFESYDFLFVGGVKYIMLILLEVIIFHICRRTMEILTGEASDLTFNSFVKAQVRMIKVVFRTYFMEIVFTTLIKITFGIVGAYEFLEWIAIFAVQCYFLGFLVMDNYNEQFHLSIKESLKHSKQFIGVSLATGLVLNALFLLPVVGPIAGPLIAAVALTLIMFRISDLHLTAEEVPVQSAS